jgi:hypothetical protein
MNKRTDMNKIGVGMRLQIGILICGLWGASFAAAATTVWTDWTSATNGAPGSAAGVLNGVAVTYSGEVLSNKVINGTAINWSPNSSFIGGTVTSSPSTVGDIITLDGAFTGNNTITFASPIINPVVAIWSLGAPRSPASFTFNATPTFEAGGANGQFGGGPITVSGNSVSGQEGNGVVQFTGSFKSISWTDTPEFYYGFTVGTAGPIPEPSAYVLLSLGLGLLGVAVRRAAAR